MTTKFNAALSHPGFGSPQLPAQKNRTSWDSKSVSSAAHHKQVNNTGSQVCRP
eukprot:CAMPEP_0171627202 /NCGR_PEP_ID=MMETSP0990-20121206/20595_1 /TAXON_ID=483369 /ORGANISM="non described non described, Strain CCMP2098" /LENGTH=52 /DNA_ID=CAMNT_0012194939 /DNA_START=84 /DNA_END=239 /DNA_ORIENTATION=+